MASRRAADRTDEGGAIARRYGYAAATEWQPVLAHFALGEGFALIVLIVPDRDGARLCRAELERVLSRQKRNLRSLPAKDQHDLVQIASSLPDQVPGKDIGAVWVEAVVAPSAPEFAAWESAWRVGLEGLNQQRNPLRASFHCPVLIVAAPWVVPLFRDVAPDLWSIRSQVVRIEPEHDLDRRRPEEARQAARSEERAQADSPDPTFALAEARRLRGAPDRVRDLSILLIRAGQGLLNQRRLDEAEATLRDATEQIAGLNDASLLGTALHELGRAILAQGRAAEAESMFRRGLALEEEDGATATSRGIAADMLGRAILNQGRAAEAEDMFRRALALQEEGGATATPRGITTDNLGWALLDQGRAAEAEYMFRRGLALGAEGGATATARGVTADMLGRAILDQGRTAEAEEMFHRALALLEEGGATATPRGITLHELGGAILGQGRAAEAEDKLRRALALKEKGGDKAASRGITADMLGRAILDQGRATEAEAMFRRALALAEEGGAPAEVVDGIRHDLARATKPAA